MISLGTQLWRSSNLSFIFFDTHAAPWNCLTESDPIENWCIIFQPRLSNLPSTNSIACKRKRPVYFVLFPLNLLPERSVSLIFLVAPILNLYPRSSESVLRIYFNLSLLENLFATNKEATVLLYKDGRDVSDIEGSYFRSVVVGNVCVDFLGPLRAKEGGEMFWHGRSLLQLHHPRPIKVELTLDIGTTCFTSSRERILYMYLFPTLLLLLLLNIC